MHADLISARTLRASGDMQAAERALRQVLATEPDHVEALRELAVLLVQRGRPAEALPFLRRAVVVEPGDATIWNHIGVIQASAKQYDDAADSFKRAIELDPGYPDAIYNLGNALRRTGRLDEAARQFERAIEVAPTVPAFHYNYANTLRDLGRLNDAAAEYQRAIQYRPGYLKAYNNLGNIFREQGKLSEAVATYEIALRTDPAYAEGHHNLGVVFTLQRQYEAAVGHFRQALSLNPDFAAARNGLGKALLELGRLEEATDVLRSAGQMGEINARTQLRLAEKLRQAGRFDEAAARIEEVLKVNADSAEAYNNMGLVCLSRCDFEQAITCYRKALAVRPDFAEAHNNLAIALDMHGASDEAIMHIQAALRLQPGFSTAHLNRAVLWLKRGDFDLGWHEFEWRRHCERHRIPPHPAPYWCGDQSEEHTVLLHAEQGLGDTIQFIRYAPLVKRRCAKVVLQCQQALKSLLQKCPGVDLVLARGESLPEYHAQLPLVSLPAVLGTTGRTIPCDIPYLFPDDDLVAQWRDRLEQHRAAFRVGISWQGNPSYAGDRLRSPPLRCFEPVVRVPGVRVFSLQKGPGTEQLADVRSEWDIVDFGPELDTTAGAFMDTAAVLHNLDLLISSDTAIVHLAGALGLPVWTALSKAADWRWLEERDDSPWYPTMRLFRQKRLNDWQELFARIARELSDVVNGRAGRLPPARERLPVTVTAPTGVGELLDRIAILQIKAERISDPGRAAHVLHELATLVAARDKAVAATPELDDLERQLRSVNETLWDIEDRLRLCERDQDFGPHFVELARSVYRTNDRRAELKRRVNELTSSSVVEQKQYCPSNAPPGQG